VPGRYDISRDQLADLLAGEPSYRVNQVWDGLHRRAVGPDEMTELPAALRRRLATEPALAPGLETVARVDADAGRTVKWLWGLPDGARVESVVMRYPGRATVCVSTQAGCAMACAFCATGQAGFTRHLSSGEIVEQVVRARREIRPDRLTNVVFMGQGEPMANYERVWDAVTRIHDELGISARHLTLSTVGLVPGIRRLAAAPLPVNLAVSLHAANDRLRDRLVPVNRRYPLADLLAACRDYLAARGRRLSFEWALIAGVNDRPTDARELAGLARPLGAHVNLIPLNPTPGYPTRGTAPAGVRAFRDDLRGRGVNATVRQNRGTGIDAACGQLAGRVAVAPAPVPH
jgi:23S rRNA (adenine2503-C2)-methyltransferase